jgi:rubrerythrin
MCTRLQKLRRRAAVARRRLKAIDALRLAIHREREAVNFYREAAARLENGLGQTVLAWLAREESRHLSRLRQQLNTLLESSRWME